MYSGVSDLAYKSVQKFLIRPAQKFIIELGEYEFENLLKDIHPGICQHFILHFQNDVLQGFPLIGNFILQDEAFQGEMSCEDICQGLVGVGNVGNIFKVVRRYAVVVGDLFAICPDPDRCPGGITVGAKLIFPIL